MSISFCCSYRVKILNFIYIFFNFRASWRIPTSSHHQNRKFRFLKKVMTSTFKLHWLGKLLFPPHAPTVDDHACLSLSIKHWTSQSFSTRPSFLIPPQPPPRSLFKKKGADRLLVTVTSKRHLILQTAALMSITAFKTSLPWLTEGRSSLQSAPSPSSTRSDPITRFTLTFVINMHSSSI